VRFGLLLAIFLSLAPAPAWADDSHRLELGPGYRGFPAWEYAAAGTLLVGSGLIRLLSTPPAKASIRGGWLFDDAVREVFGGVSPESRDRADFWSDLMWWGAQAFPVVIDGLLVGWLLDGFNHEVGWQITAMSYEAYAVAGILTSASHALIGRERPSGYACEQDGTYDPLCGSRALYASFLSGHTSMAFAGAGLTCAHHQHLPLFGGNAWDAAACGLTTVMATATALLRVIADRHYVSDVVLSAAIGFAAGYLLPTFLHYRGGQDGGASASSTTLVTPLPAAQPQLRLGASF
jgi:membrane-associated phospholipid phosphatase